MWVFKVDLKQESSSVMCMPLSRPNSPLMNLTKKMDKIIPGPAPLSGSKSSLLTHTTSFQLGGNLSCSSANYQTNKQTWTKTEQPMI